MALIDSRIYVDGRRIDQPHDLDQTFDALKQSHGVAWIGLASPTPDELASVGDEFSLHPLAIEDARKGHQRAKIDRYGATLFVVLRPAWYDEGRETVHFGEVHLFVGPHFAVTVRHGDQPDLGGVRVALESEPDFLSLGSEAALTAFLDEVVDGYAPVAAALQADVDEIEDSLFGAGDIDPELSKRIYQLLSQAIQFQRAIGPVPDMLRGLLRRQMSSASLAQGEESRLLAEQTIEQGEEVKKISSWAAILFTPTLVASVYGMNFERMPELKWPLGYPFAVGLMIVLGLGLWGVFKYKRWL